MKSSLHFDRFFPYPVMLIILFLAIISRETECLAQHLEKVHIKGNFSKNGEEVPFDLHIVYTKIDLQKISGIVFWGSDDLPNWKPRWVIKSFTFTLNGKLIVFPESAFNDLGNPLLPLLPTFDGRDQKAVSIFIGGSDGAGSYTSVFKLKNGHLVERKTQSHEDSGGDAQIMIFSKSGIKAQAKTHDESEKDGEVRKAKSPDSENEP